MVEHFLTTWWLPALTKRSSGAISVRFFGGPNISKLILREEHGDEFLKVTQALAERLANAGREGDAEEVQELEQWNIHSFLDF